MEARHPGHWSQRTRWAAELIPSDTSHAGGWHELDGQIDQTDKTLVTQILWRRSEAIL